MTRDEGRGKREETTRNSEVGVRRAGLLQQMRQDARYAIRALLRAPGFAVIAVLTLALGIGANTAIFSVVRGILLRPLPFQDPDRLVMVSSVYNGHPAPSSPANAYDFQDQSHSFTSMAVVTAHSAVLTGSGEPERLRGADVSANLFGILGVKAMLGRSVFTGEEAAWHGSKSVLVNESLWRTRFGSDTSLVGKIITLDNERYLVAGIVPAESAWPATASIWFAFTYDPAQLANSRGAVYLDLVGRLKPGVTIERAGADLRAISGRLEKDFPNVDANVGSLVVPMSEWITGTLRRPLFVLLGGVAFVLLIACANVANLMLVRGVAREGEIAVRTALGASRGRLVRQLVTESVVLALTGGAAGFVLAIAGTKLLVGAAPATIPRLTSIHVDGVVLAFTLVVAVVTGIVFGLVPARQVARPDVAQTLRDGGRGGARAGGHRARRALVVAEMALSVMLLAGAGLLIRSFNHLIRVNPGFRTDHSISFALSLPSAKYKTPESQSQFVSALMERVRAIGGVQAAGAGFGMPLTRFGYGFSFEVIGRPPVKPADQPDAQFRVATPDYFATMGIPVIKGRGFAAADRAGSPRVMLITETAAQQFFPNENPIGKHIRMGTSDANNQPLEAEMVGIVGDVKQSSLALATQPQFWFVYDQVPMSSFNVVIHTSRDPQAVVADARRAVKEIDPDLAVAQVKTLEQIVAESVAQPRFYMTLLTAFALVALVLSAIGIYGVIAYLVGQRSREIGIRLALGATSGAVLAMIVRESAVMTAAGIVVGLAGALAITQLMGALLFGIAPTDPITYVTVTALLASVALAASSVPAMRAARVDPALAMRAE